jgi:hypothetical protein
MYYTEEFFRSFETITFLHMTGIEKASFTLAFTNSANIIFPRSHLWDDDDDDDRVRSIHRIEPSLMKISRELN